SDVDDGVAAFAANGMRLAVALSAEALPSVNESKQYRVLAVDHFGVGGFQIEHKRIDGFAGVFGLDGWLIGERRESRVDLGSVFDDRFRSEFESPHVPEFWEGRSARMIEVGATGFAWVGVEELNLPAGGELFFEVVEDVFFGEFFFIDVHVTGGAAID